MTPVIHHGDCLEVMAGMPENSVDAIVTDPPYGLGFMGRKWDALPPGQEWAGACLRVLKPGGHLLAFGGTRTWHRLAVAIEDAGFEMRDSLAWLYGSGFPKSHDVSKGIDKLAGAEREALGVAGRSGGGRSAMNDAPGHGRQRDYLQGEYYESAPATPEAAQWDGWGTALKPAFEPIVLARKPLAEKTVARNVLAHGTGAINVDACRIDSGARPLIISKSEASTGILGDGLNGSSSGGETTQGRWPANVVLDEHAAAELDQQSGQQRDGVAVNRNRDPLADKQAAIYGTYRNGDRPDVTYGSGGGASRFFYVARKDETCPPSLNSRPANTAGKNTSRLSPSADSARDDAATSESPAGVKPTGSPSTSGTPTASRPSASSGTTETPTLADEPSPAQLHAKPTPSLSPASNALNPMPTATMTTTPNLLTFDGFAAPATSSTTPSPQGAGEPGFGLDSRFMYTAKAPRRERPNVDGVQHPTVKPLALMRWLVRLVTPPGGTVLDPFAGSGTTIEAALIEGFNPIGIEMTDEYLPLIQHRITRQEAR